MPVNVTVDASGKVYVVNQADSRQQRDDVHLERKANDAGHHWA
jgi:hypothetical protein